MTFAASAFTDESDSRTAGTDLGNQILQKLDGRPAHAVMVFVSPRYDYAELLKSLDSVLHAEVMVGCSSAGEFAAGDFAEGAASALAISSDQMQFSVGHGRNIRQDARAAAKSVVESFHALQPVPYAYRSALVLADALSGRTEEMIDELTILTGGTYKFFGGGAGDDANFTTTHVFVGTEVYTDAVVGLEILSRKPVGVGVSHGWVPGGDLMRVTESHGNRLVSLNTIAAADAFDEHAAATGQTFDRSNPVPFFLHNVIGIKTQDGYKLRVPLALEPDGTVICASDIPEGAAVQIMKSPSNSAQDAARQAVNAALSQTEPAKPCAALFFDCVATRLRLGRAFEEELGAVKSVLKQGTDYVGCNTYGQIARAEDQFSGFHNCTAVVCVFPE
jgi:hypothetical protein